MLPALLLLAAATPRDDICSQYATRKDCLYAPAPRCSWEESGGTAACVCAIDSCEPVDLCVLEAATEAACDKAMLPNGAPCTWNATGAYCTCKDEGCTTKQPACTVDEHCEDDCAFPCECAAGNCYLVDECWRFDGPQCAASMWRGASCCDGVGTGSDKGCFLCDAPPLCQKQPPSPPASASIVRSLPLGVTVRPQLV